MDHVDNGARKDMLTNALRDFANWRTERQGNCTQIELLAWTPTISRKRNLNQLENYSQIVVKCWYLPRIGRLDIL